jgi:uncharacterized protein (TIGR02147 family)
MMKQVFEFRSYKPYLSGLLGQKGQKTGRRSEAARHMGCQTAYLSQVLNGDAHLSLEQAFSMNEFLGHDEEQGEFFLLLVQKERAGTSDLKKYFTEKLEKLAERRLVIKNRLKDQETLSVSDQAVYYSSWYYACIHVMVTIPGLQDKESIAKHLNLPLTTIAGALEFLVSRGLVIEEGARYKMGPRHVHLGHDALFIAKHHTNWRTRALVAIDHVKKDDLHYSMVGTISRADARKIKERVVELIQENMKTFAPSKEECVFVSAFDFFEI